MTIRLTWAEAAALAYLRNPAGSGNTAPTGRTLDSLQRKGFVRYDPATRVWALTQKGKDH